MRILGVDPGASGALALLWCDRGPGERDRLVAVADMPVFTVKRGKTAKAEIDALTLRDLVEEWRPSICFFEKVGGIQGQSASAAFNFGRAAGVAEGIIRGRGAQFHLIPPATWKRRMGLLGGGKDEARAAATSLWPGNASDFRRKKDDGRAEAALLAEYGRRLLLQEAPQRQDIFA